MEKDPDYEALLAKLAKPAQRALTGAGYLTLEEIARAGEEQTLSLHGMGPNAISKVRQALQSKGLHFS